MRSRGRNLCARVRRSINRLCVKGRRSRRVNRMADQDSLVAGARALGEQDELIKTIQRLLTAQRATQAVQPPAPIASSTTLADVGPFEAAAMRQREAVQPASGRREGVSSLVLSKYLPHVSESLATLPQRAFGASEMMRTEGPYDPKAPLEAAGLLVGSPITPRGALGATLKRNLDAEAFLGKGGGRSYDIQVPGRPDMPLNVRYDPVKKDIYVSWMGDPRAPTTEKGAPTAQGTPANIGLRETKSVFEELRKEFPEALTVSGYRISGARTKEGSMGAETIKMRLPGVKEKAQLREPPLRTETEIRADSYRQRARSEPSSAELDASLQSIIDAIENTGRRR